MSDQQPPQWQPQQPPPGQPPYGQYGQPQQQWGQQPPPQFGQQPFGQPPFQQAGPGKDWLTTLLLCIFLGWLGVHRFYTGHTVLGVLQILTVGGCGIWTLVDLIMIITGSYRDANGYPLVRTNM